MDLSYSEDNIQEISSIAFGVFSSQDVIDMAACKVENTKKTGYGSVYDERMGTIDSTKDACETCGETAEKCPGHFGYIEFNEPILHPLYYKRIVTFLNCFCIQCSRLLLTEDQIKLSDITKYKGESRFNQIQEKLKKVNICCHIECGCIKPTCKFITADSSIVQIHESKDKTKTGLTFSTEEIYKIFDNILDSDVHLLGFDPELTHPRNFIISSLPVLPICARPYVKADGNICDDDLTIQYIEIIKANQALAPDANGKPPNNTKRQKFLATLRFRVLTTFNNSQGKAKHTTNGRVIKAIKERLTGKSGQLRNNLMGRRSCKSTEMIWMWDGSMKKAEDVKVGDVVIGDDGLQRPVISTVSGESLMYKVKQKDGDDYEVSCAHILTLKFCGHGEIHWRENSSTYGLWFMSWFDRETKSAKTKKITCVPPLSIEDAKLELEKFMKENNLEKQKINWCPKRKNAGTWRTNWSENGKSKSKEIAVVPGLTKEQAYEQMIEFRNTIDTSPIIDIAIEDYLALPQATQRLLLGIKLSTPIMWPKQEIFIDPRILGMWLGDGTKNGCVFTNPDSELIEYFKKWVEDQGGKFKTYEDDLHHRFSGTTFLNDLRGYDLLGNKHIPEDYILNDVETRLELLAGLIDTDGSVEQDGATVRISQCIANKAILYGAQRIAVSLGFRTSLFDRPPPKVSSFKNITGGPQMILSICGSLSRIPTLLPRKKCRDSKIDACSTNIKVEENGIGKFCGFEVSGPTNRFILGNDATITHNCNQTARTVIGPDPTLKLGELVMPREIASTLSIPVRVTRFNMDEMQKRVNSGEIDYILPPDGKSKINLKNYRRGTRIGSGDIIIRGVERIEVKTGKEKILDGDKIEREGVLLKKVLASDRAYKVSEGWIIERKLQTGDCVLLNRQPTLHKASMMAMKIKVMPYKTIRMNLAVCKSFNADFDGDEMNIHVPQTLEARAELEFLSNVESNIISPQSSKPNITIVQDSLLGAFRMTKGFLPVKKSQFFDISMKLELRDDVLDRIQHISSVYKKMGIKQTPYNGKGIISLFLPRDLLYEHKNGGDVENPVVKIYQGVLYEGTLNKDSLGSSFNSLISVINKEYGSEEAGYFVDSIQFCTNEWNLIYGFTIGLGDCLVADKEKNKEISGVVQKSYIEAEGIKDTTTHSGIRELRINATLNKAKDVGLRIAKESFDPSNNFLSTVQSGSKGDFFNIAQITGLLGQQNLKGNRVPQLLSNGKRTLPHYPLQPISPEMEYESRGFISSSFINGLNAREFYMHAMSGREGISDTAMGTATSGYMQRRIVKLMEDMKTQYDGTVRDNTGHVYQFAYGNTNLDPTKTVKVNGEQQTCNVSRIINRLNDKYKD